jgi:nucleotide-binding universal stress UspA family protein
MSGIQRILVATDFSPGAHAALECASSLATRFGATVDVVYVWLPPKALPLHTPAGKKGKSTLSDIARRAASLQMSSFIGDADARQAVRPRVEVGVPHELIITLAATERHDLIVMGACGSGASQTRLGSVARLVLDSAPCPVLTMRAAHQVGAVAEPMARNSY